MLHENVVIISAKSENVPHVPYSETLGFDDLGYADDGIIHFRLHFGFQDLPDLPRALHLACANDAKLKLDLDHASYFLSHITIRAHGRAGDEPLAQAALPRPRPQRGKPRRLLRRLPEDRTVIMGSQVEVEPAAAPAGAAPRRPLPFRGAPAWDDERPPICPACGVTMLPAELSARRRVGGRVWVCLECEESGEPDEGEAG